MKYHYDTLPAGKWFRLLHIAPGHGDDPLRCSLITTNLENQPSYKALSYVWGDPTHTELITVSEYEWTVTLSLAGGLRRLRHPENLVRAWADAICIDQTNNIEKAYQVNMMGSIYDRATEVLVWLGEDTHSLATDAFKVMVAINTMVTNGTQRTWYDADQDLIVTKGIKNVAPLRVSRDNLAPLLQDKTLEAIKQLYQLPWFTRVWVLQEVGLATKATAYWGGECIDFGEIAMFIWSAMNDHDLKGRLDEGVIRVLSKGPYSALWNIWSTYEKKNSWINASPPLKAWADHIANECNLDFVLVLEASRVFNATDARDHIYAFLGHPRARRQGSESTIVVADYELSLEHLLRTVAERLAMSSLNFLVQVQNTVESLAQSESCSWVPYWSINDRSAPIAFWEAWDASLRVSTHYAPQVSTHGPELMVSAVIFDHVGYQSNVARGLDSLNIDQSFEEIGSVLAEFWNLTELAAESVPHRYRESHSQHILAFASVLMCDYRPKDRDDSYYEAIAGNFCHACLYYCESIFNEKIRPLKLSYDMRVMPHREFAAGFQYYCNNRRFFVTEGGYWGIGPAAMQKGDVCAVLIGADVPFVLRPTATEGTYRLVGQAYIYGIMYGEVMQQVGVEPDVLQQKIIIF